VLLPSRSDRVSVAGPWVLNVRPTLSVVSYAGTTPAPLGWRDYDEYQAQVADNHDVLLPASVPEEVIWLSAEERGNGAPRPPPGWAAGYPGSIADVVEPGRKIMADSSDLGVERTLVLLKPDAVARGLAGRILARFEDAALKIVGVKMKWMDAEFTRQHYFDLEQRLGADIYNCTAGFMQTGPVIAVALEGVEAVAKVRKIIGNTYPNEAPPGTVRGDYAHQTKASSEVSGKAVMNLVHASGNSDEAKYEVNLWFTAEELYEYETLAEKLAY
jgi:nucleoside-diphosphate kinase